MRMLKVSLEFFSKRERFIRSYKDLVKYAKRERFQQEKLYEEVNTKTKKEIVAYMSNFPNKVEKSVYLGEASPTVGQPIHHTVLSRILRRQY